MTAVPGAGPRAHGRGLISPAAGTEVVPPEWAYAAALAGLPYMAWDRLTTLLAGTVPSEAWRKVEAGGAGAAWARAAAATSVADVAAAHEAAGIDVVIHGHPCYPAALAGDHEPPPVLFRLGTMPPADGPRVGIVGTRRATGYGRDVARQLGREITEAGVSVVSGLALGIDGAAHEGALAALRSNETAGGAACASGSLACPASRPVAVVGSGLDVVYPGRHTALWHDVALAGVLLSESPLGTRPEPWRFPARNRLIAALAHVLVVVESHSAGGSLHTVRAAAERGVTVMAVPGPVRSAASAGTNRLLSDGCPPACDADDILVALALETSARAPRADTRPAPLGADAEVLALLGWHAVSLDDVLARCDLAPSRVAVALTRLEQQGWARGRGGWWERAEPS